MSIFHIVCLSISILIIATLYSSVGHGGASGYLAVMSLFCLSAVVIKPTVFILNIFVSTFAFIQFYRAGFFSSSTFWPFAIGSIPCAFLGGFMSTSTSTYKMLMGIVLLFSIYPLLIQPQIELEKREKRPPLLLSYLAGVGIGFVSGLIGIGGGIFLSPLLLLTGWANAKKTSAISAAFIVVNSLAGLCGYIYHIKDLPEEIAFFSLAAIIGGMIGSQLGAYRLRASEIRRLLGIVLMMAAFKLIFLI
jgi:uncharacterized protein